MATLQHDGAREVLSIVTPAWKEKKYLTYKQVAKQMGRDPVKHARAIAAMCDFLDAAACIAGVPLLALVAVRAEDGDINKDAWVREYQGRRQAIIDCSLHYRFTDRDYDAITAALDELADCSTKRAWAIVAEKGYVEERLFLRLTRHSNGSLSVDDAINDLGTDEPEQRIVTTTQFARDQAVRKAVLERANGTCEHCGALGFLKQNGKRYLETHHITELSHRGADRPSNVIALCPNDHREAHFGKNKVELEQAMIHKLNQFTKRT